jgi:hypothetical protein
MADVKPYPVNVTGELSDPPGRWQWLFKWLLAFPHYIVIMCLGVASFLVTVYAFFAILFTGKYPRFAFDFNVGVLRWSWRVGFYTYQTLGTDKYPPFSMEKGGYPADLDIEYPEKLSRGLVLIKWWLLAIPHYIIVSIFQGGENNAGITSILSIICGFIVLFTGKYPEDLFKFIVGMNRWVYRVFAYVMLMTDEYPPFRFDP